MSTWTITPNSYTAPAQPKVPHSDPVGQFWKLANPGDFGMLDPGNYKRITLAQTLRPFGSEPVTIEAVPGTVLFQEDTSVGSSDTIDLKSGLSDLSLIGLSLEVDDRAGLKTEESRGARRVFVKNCKILGRGPGFSDPTWKGTGKWGEHHYDTGAWTHLDCEIGKVFEEHADYRNTIQGNHIWSGTKVWHCGRTRIQIVNRQKNGSSVAPEGYGNCTFINEDVRDVCVEQNGGGSAYTFRGGMPSSSVMLDRCKVRLGCDPTLAAPWNKNITGALLMDSGPESKPGAGDAAHPGGTGKLLLMSPDFEIGSVWPGSGSALRPCVRVGECGEFMIDWGTTGRIVRHPIPGGTAVAIEIYPTCKSFKYTGKPAEWMGQMIYNGQKFATWDLFAQAHPELKA